MPGLAPRPWTRARYRHRPFAKFRELMLNLSPPQTCPLDSDHRRNAKMTEALASCWLTLALKASRQVQSSRHTETKLCCCLFRFARVEHWSESALIPSRPTERIYKVISMERHVKHQGPLTMTGMEMSRPGPLVRRQPSQPLDYRRVNPQRECIAST